MRVDHTYVTYVSSLHEGISKNIHNLTTGLTDRGVDARVAAPTVDVEDLNRKTTHFRKGFECLDRLKTSLRDPATDAVHYHISIPSLGLLSTLARGGAHGSDTPIVGHLWNPYFTLRDTVVQGGAKDLLMHLAFNSGAGALLGFPSFDAVVVSSRYQADQLRRTGYGGPIHEVPNGVDLDAYQPATDQGREAARDELGLPRDRDIILYYGHLTPWKGVINLVNALPAVVREHPQAEVVIARTAYGSEEARIRHRLQELGVAHRVTFLGLTHVPTLLQAADVGTVPMISSVGTACHPNVLLEYLAAGVPVVASDVGSVPEVVRHGDSGLLFPPGDAEGMAEHLTYLLDNPKARGEMGRNARRTAEARFDWRAIAKEVEAVYAQLT